MQTPIQQNETSSFKINLVGAASSRRQFLTRTLQGGAAALGLGMVPLTTPKASAAVVDDIAVLNYALTLEHLEYAFYRDGMKHFTRRDPFSRPVISKLGPNLAGGLYDNLIRIRDHESAHVDTLIQVITSLGGTPVQELRYNFGYRDFRSFLKVAQALENTGVMAYDGAIASIGNRDLQTAGATIATIEARHASYLNLVNGDVPFPRAFDVPKTMNEIFAIAGQFIVS